MSDPEAFNKWYKANAAKLNERRRAKYHTDSAYRDNVVERQREYRANNPRQQGQSQKHVRVVSGKEVEVFRIGEVSVRIGRSEGLIRRWERQGKIPKPSVPGAHRYYTLNQIKLMKELADLIDVICYDVAIRDTGISKKSKEIHSKWEK